MKDNYRPSAKMCLGSALLLSGLVSVVLLLSSFLIKSGFEIIIAIILMMIGGLMMLDIKINFGLEIKKDRKDKHNQENNQDFTKEVPL